MGHGFQREIDMHRTRWAAVTALAAFALLGIACSSSEKKTEATPTAAAATAAAKTATTAPTAAATATPAGPATVPPLTPAGPDGSVKATIAGFKLPTLTVKAGTVVEFVNQDSTAHTASADNDAFNSGSIAQNASFKFTANKVGAIAYACMIHPTMTGFIVVQ